MHSQHAPTETPDVSHVSSREGRGMGGRQRRASQQRTLRQHEALFSPLQTRASPRPPETLEEGVRESAATQAGPSATMAHASPHHLPDAHVSPLRASGRSD